MNTGISLQQLAQQVSTERDRAADFRVRTSAIHMNDDLTVTLGDTGINVAPRDLFHQQLAEKLQIPFRYYQRLRTEAPSLLTKNTNHWLSAGNGEKRLVRTFAPTKGHSINPPNTPNEGRAFLSATYRPLDHFDLMTALVPALLGSGLTVKSSQLTETRLYLQLVSDKLTADVKVGDPVNMGLIVDNSEVGKGALNIRALIYRLRCLNGLVLEEDLPSFRRVHIGSEFAADDSILTDEARRARDAAIWLQARDTIKAAVSQTTFETAVAKLRGIAGVKLANPEAAVELVAKRFDLAESERNDVMKNLIEGADLSLWGLTNSVTALAHNAADYDRSVEIEVLGGKVAALPASLFGNN